MSKGSFLDVDESIRTRNLLLTDNKDGEEMSALLNTINTSERPSVIIRPSPGACVKARLESGEKLFLNVCKTTEIPPPDDISDEKLLSVMEDESETPSYRIPMSIGHERLEADKAGTPCLTYDVAVNSGFFEKCKRNKLFWSFTIAVAIQGVSNKFDRRINETDFVVLKNRKVAGKLQDHRIEKREVRRVVSEKPLIEEISSATNRPYVADAEGKSIPAGAKREEQRGAENERNVRSPEYVILRKPKEGKIERLIGRFRMQDLVSVDDVAVDVGEDRIVIEARKSGYLMDIFVPYSIRQSDASATFDRNVGMLCLDMPVQR